MTDRGAPEAENPVAWRQRIVVGLPCGDRRSRWSASLGTRAGQHCSHPSRAIGKSRVAQCVNASMNSMQPSRSHPAMHGVVADTRRAQLADRDDSMLLFAKPSHSQIGLGHFSVHMTDKWPTTRVLPRPNGQSTLAADEIGAVPLLRRQRGGEVGAGFDPASEVLAGRGAGGVDVDPVSYKHLRAHETD